MLWDLAEGKRLYSLDAGDVIHALCFSPNRYWLCAATQACIKVPHFTLTCLLGDGYQQANILRQLCPTKLHQCVVHIDKVLH